MEEKVLYNVLRQISKNEIPNAAPDKEYLKSLENIGLVELGWDNNLTKFGNTILKFLENKLHSY